MKGTRPIVLLLALCMPGVLLSCAAPEPVQWSQVKKNPPTYYPSGFDHRPGKPLPSGHWVSSETGDERFYIPDSGAGSFNASELHSDALARVSPNALPPRTRASVGVGIGFLSF